MRCKECKETEIIKINEPDNVKFQCKNGHVWYEDYIDEGGNHFRPKTYDVKLEDTLYPSEKLLYEKVLKELGRTPEFYMTAEPLEKTKALIKNCESTEKDIYILMKKIARFQK